MRQGIACGRERGRRREKGITFLLALLLTITLLPVNALAAEEQQAKFDPTERGTGYSAVLYDYNNGLPTAEANAIAETGSGLSPCAPSSRTGREGFISPPRWDWPR